MVASDCLCASRTISARLRCRDVCNPALPLVAVQAMRVLIGCEESGIVRDAFLARGHEALSVDLQPTRRPGPHYQGDIFDVLDFPWDLAIVHIPCTHSSVSGAKHFAAKKMDGRYYAGNALWMRAWKGCEHIPRVCFEHPVSVISSLFRKPDQIIQPHMFGHPELKTTCLWLRRLPHLVATQELPPPYTQRVWRLGPSETRARERSETYPGIADAMASQWGAAAESVAA